MCNLLIMNAQICEHKTRTESLENIYGIKNTLIRSGFVCSTKCVSELSLCHPSLSRVSFEQHGKITNLFLLREGCFISFGFHGPVMFHTSQDCRHLSESIQTLCHSTEYVSVHTVSMCIRIVHILVP